MTEKKTISLDELRAQVEEHQEAWKGIPLEEILAAISADLQTPEARAIMKRLRPLLEALPDTDQLKPQLGGLIGIFTNLPVLISQRLAAAPAQ